MPVIRHGIITGFFYKITSMFFNYFVYVPDRAEARVGISDAAT